MSTSSQAQPQTPAWRERVKEICGGRFRQLRRIEDVLAVTVYALTGEMVYEVQDEDDTTIIHLWDPAGVVNDVVIIYDKGVTPPEIKAYACR